MTTFKKRGDIIAEEIKRWIVSKDMGAGQRLPSEATLTELFNVGKSSVREALKSLEVQGLVRTTAGQTGGSFIVAVPEARAISLLQNFFYFKKLTADQIYELRQTIEPKLAAAVAQNVTAEAIAALRQKVEACRPEPRSREELASQMKSNIEFHDILAEHSPNPLMCFHCRFVNRLVAQIVKRRESADQRGVLRANFAAHAAILEAIEARDSAKAEKRMSDHIAEIQSFYPKMRVENQFLAEQSHPVVVPALEWPQDRKVEVSSNGNAQGPKKRKRRVGVGRLRGSASFPRESAGE